MAGVLTSLPLLFSLILILVMWQNIYCLVKFLVLLGFILLCSEFFIHFTSVLTPALLGSHQQSSSGQGGAGGSSSGGGGPHGSKIGSEEGSECNSSITSESVPGGSNTLAHLASPRNHHGQVGQTGCCQGVVFFTLASFVRCFYMSRALFNAAHTRDDAGPPHSVPCPCNNLPSPCS